MGVALFVQPVFRQKQQQVQPCYLAPFAPAYTDSIIYPGNHRKRTGLAVGQFSDYPCRSHAYGKYASSERCEYVQRVL